MNIGQTMRALMGELRTGEARTLELRPGQVVRGVVTRIDANQQATVTINGVTIQALMEAGLKAGDTALLQVQPPGADGAIRLKLASAGTDLDPTPVSQGAAAPSGADGQLRSLGVAATKANLQAAELLQEAGVPLTKEAIQAAAAALRSVPAGIGKEAWAETVKLALGKGLPLSAAVLEAVHAVVHGDGPDRAFAAMAEQVKAALTDGSGAAAGKGGELLRQLSRLLEQAAAVVERGVQGREPQAAGDSPASPGAGGKPAPVQAGSGAAETGGGSALAEGRPAGEAAAGAAAVGNGRAGSTAAGQTREARAQAQPAAGTSAASTAGEGASAGKPATAAAAASGALAPSGDEVLPGATARGASATPQPEADQAASGNWLSRLLEQLGLEHESKAARLPGGSAPSGMEEAAVRRSDSVRSEQAATLKDVLLQTVRHEDLPETVKEATRQALQQITGQQLLLSGDRTQMLSHLTVMVPFYNAQGRQTAAVHVESRRNERGELDADNCRLLFDLSMRSLGPLLVDVQVTDRSVGIRVLNDHELSATLFAADKAEIAAVLEASGYHLAYLQTASYPERNPAQAGSASGQRDEVLFADKRERPGFRQRPYKGMDVRI